MKLLSIVALVLMLLVMVGCGGGQDKSTGEQTAVAVPQTDLHSAVVSGDLDIIKQHIKAGSDLNVLEPSRASTPLITAAFLGNTDAAKLLIDAGADINYKNADGSTALHTAAAFGKVAAQYQWLPLALAVSIALPVLMVAGFRTLAKEPQPPPEQSEPIE